MILGGGPNRIGEGIEYNYFCTHAAFDLRDLGYYAIMVNCNPGAVSTDPDISNSLYYEPLTVEDILDITQGETGRIIVQLGGQTHLRQPEIGAAESGFRHPNRFDFFHSGRGRLPMIMQKLGIP